MVSVNDTGTANRVALARALDQLCELLAWQAEQRLNPAQGDARPAAPPPPPALLKLAQRLEISPFEQQTLLLCAATELDERVAPLCARAQGESSRPYATYALALSLFAEPRWDALSPERPLRYWQLLEVNQPPDRALTASPLRADERIVSYLQGFNYLDDRLRPFVTRAEVALATYALPPSQQEKVDAAVAFLRATSPDRPLPLVQLVGIDEEGKQLVSQHVATELGLQLYRLPARILPVKSTDLDFFQRLWQRECRLMPLALFLDAHEVDFETHEETTADRALQFLDRADGVFILSTRDVWDKLSRETLSLDIAKPETAEQAAAWRRLLTIDDERFIGQLAAQYNLGIPAIHQIAELTLGNSATSREPEDVRARLWGACQVHTRPRLDVLAQRITPKATWTDIILPEQELALLRQVADQVQHRAVVYDHWGFRQRFSRGLGMTVLFSGESGTGKTMAAEILANHLELNLYRIDLSGVVSKYIGETEKNLRKLFDAAEDGGAILLFDEGDALFGKRSTVKDSHDRYANIEVSYLLQRVESFHGLAILTTNLREGFDEAFVRRLRFVVEFPFPNASQREAIWRRIFPAGTPLSELDYERLGQFKMTGGSIYNVALNAAFTAAGADEPVSMPHILNSARVEFTKWGRLVNEPDFQWDG